MTSPKSLLFGLLLLTHGSLGWGKTELLNVSYDPTRELYQAVNPLFEAQWAREGHGEVSISQSHGASAKQAQSVVDGLKADVVSLALAPDLDALVKAKLVQEHWQDQLPYHSAPYTSTVVLLVRKGNPKQIRDWNDLIRADVGVVTANPKTSGGSRWGYLAAWGYALRSQGLNQEGARLFVKSIFDRVVALDAGSRAATQSFVDKGLGDVLITWENEAYSILKKDPQSGFEIVTPSLSILAEPVVAVVDAVVDVKGSRQLATEYLRFLYSEPAQEVIAQNYFRPRNVDVAQKYEHIFKPIVLFSIDEVFGGWTQVQATHFSEGGILDKILEDRQMN